MSELDEKLSSILGNPQMMQQIMFLAQSMGSAQPEQPAPPPAPTVDPAVVQTMSRMAAGGKVDQKEQALLTALSPYLSQSRVSKLERAMRAAKIAGAASAFLGAGGLQKLTGR